jgi:hypothetical protein
MPSATQPGANAPELPSDAQPERRPETPSTFAPVRNFVTIVSSCHRNRQDLRDSGSTANSWTGWGPRSPPTPAPPTRRLMADSPRAGTFRPIDHPDPVPRARPIVRNRRAFPNRIFLRFAGIRSKHVVLSTLTTRVVSGSPPSLVGDGPQPMLNRRVRWGASQGGVER